MVTGMASVASCAAMMDASATLASSTDWPGLSSTERTPAGPDGPHIATANAAGAVAVGALIFGALSRNAAAVRLAPSRGTLPMRATSVASKP